MTRPRALLNIRTVYGGEGFLFPHEAARLAAEQKIHAIGVRDRDTLAACLHWERACRDYGLKPIYGATLAVRPISSDAPCSLSFIACNATGYANLITLINARQRFSAGLPYELLVEHRDGLLMVVDDLESEVAHLLAVGAYDDVESWFSRILEHWRGRLFFEIGSNKNESLVPVFRGVSEYYADVVPTLWQPRLVYLSESQQQLAQIWSEVTRHPLLPGETFSSDWSSANDDGLELLLSHLSDFSPSHLLRQSISFTPERLQQVLREAWRIRSGRDTNGNGVSSLPKMVKQFLQALPSLSEEKAEVLARGIREEMRVIDGERAVMFYAMLNLAAVAHEKEWLVHARGPAIDSAISSLLGLSALPTEGNPASIDAMQWNENGLDVGVESGEDLLQLSAAGLWRATRFVALDAEQTWRAIADWLISRTPTAEEPARTLQSLLALRAEKDAIAQVRAQIAALPLGEQALNVFDFVMERVRQPRPGSYLFLSGDVLPALPFAHDGESDPNVMAQYDEESCLLFDFPRIVVSPSRALRQIHLVMKQIEPDTHKPYLPLEGETWRTFAEGRFEGGYLFQRDLAREMTQRAAAILGSSFSVRHLAVVVAGSTPSLTKLGRQWIQNLEDRSERWRQMYPEAMQSLFESTCGLLIFQDQATMLIAKVMNLSPAEANTILKTIRAQGLETIISKAKWIEQAQAHGFRPIQAATAWYELQRWAGDLVDRSQAMRTALYLWTLFGLRDKDPTAFFFSSLGSEREHRHMLGLASWVADAQAFGVEVYPPDINHSQLQPVREGDAIRLGLLNVPGLDEQVATALLEERERMGAFLSVEDFIYRMRRHFPSGQPLLALYSAGALDSLTDAAQTPKLARRYYDDTSLSVLLEEIATPTKPIAPSLFWQPLSVKSLTQWREGKNALARLEAVMNEEKEQLVIVEQARVVQTYRGEYMMFLRCAARDGGFNAVIFPQAFSKTYAPLCRSQLVRLRGKWDWRGKRLIVQALDSVSVEEVVKGKELHIPRSGLEIGQQTGFAVEL